MSKRITPEIEQLQQEFVQYASPKGQKILYQPTNPVENIHDPHIQKIIQDMKNHIKGKGIGLAANQIGEPLQIFIIEFEADVARYKHLDFPSIPLEVFVNPKITAVSREKIAFWHGCLSAIDWPRGLVATYQWIEYEAYDEKGKSKKGKLEGLAAVIFQHEFRHLLGSLYIDHAKYFIRTEELQRLFQAGDLIPYEAADENVPLLLAEYKVGSPIK